MGKDSKIEWTTHTFNPWRGCTKVSEGCAHCYAETLSKRNPKVLGEWGAGKPRVLASEAMWREPLNWNKRAGNQRVKDGLVLWRWGSVETVGKPETRMAQIDLPDGFNGEMPFAEWEALPAYRPRVFCASLADWLDDEVPVVWLVRLLGLIYLTPNLDWLLLTKRPQNWVTRIGQCVSFQEHVSTGAFYSWLRGWAEGEKPHNIWVGTTVENQARAEERVPVLLQIPAKVRFLSCEPLLGPVDLKQFAPFSVSHGVTIPANARFWGGLDWVIAGGESGPGARPMHPDWARLLRDQCAGAGVPFLFKQWGEWIAQHEGMQKVLEECTVWPDGRVMTQERFVQHALLHGGRRLEWEVCCMGRVGKKAAGRQLDGVEWNGFPGIEMMGRSHV